MMDAPQIDHTNHRLLGPAVVAAFEFVAHAHVYEAEIDLERQGDALENLCHDTFLGYMDAGLIPIKDLQDEIDIYNEFQDLARDILWSYSEEFMGIVQQYSYDVMSAMGWFLGISNNQFFLQWEFDGYHVLNLPSSPAQRGVVGP